jgi:PAS domain S-box-containing protein
LISIVDGGGKMTAAMGSLTGTERRFSTDEIIVSKTDLRGRIIYANEVFQRVAGFDEPELLGQPHSIIRHPAMPRCVFKLLWDTIEAKKEIFAYVLNRAKNGDHYWVFAHVSPTFDQRGNIISYHSNRRSPKREAVEKAAPLYAALLAEENRHADRKEGMASSLRMVAATLDKVGMPYDEFVFSL